MPLVNIADVTEDSLVALGNDIPIGLYANITDTNTIGTPYLETTGYKYFDLPLDTDYLNVTDTNLTFSGVTAKNATVVIEDYPEGFVANAHTVIPFLQLFVMMSFKIATPCKLKNLELFVQAVDIAATWTIFIYNATRDLDQDLLLIPQNWTGYSITQTATDAIIGPAAHWQNFTFPDVELNMSNTYVDSKGFAHYFFMVQLPIWDGLDTSLALLYYAFDKDYPGNSYSYGATIGYFEYQPMDACMKLEFAPLSSNPTPSEVGLSIVNPNRPPQTNLTVESDFSIPVAASYNFTNGGQVLAQNFTLNDYGTIQSIMLNLECFDVTEISLVGIFPANGTEPLWDANYLLDLNTSFYIPNGTKGWYNFTMADLPNLPAGEYWWVLSVQSAGNLTLYGSNDTLGNNAIALNITAMVVPVTNVTSEEIPYDFATIIYFQPGKEFFNISKDWTSDTRFLPDIFGDLHFQVFTRWFGDTAFNMTYNIELENNFLSSPYYSANFSDSVIWWNISINPTFPSTPLGKVINVTIPSDWVVNTVTVNGSDYTNWSLLVNGNRNILQIFNASNGYWVIICNSTIYPVDYFIEKIIGPQFQSANNATIYDRLRVNVTIANQTNGMCSLSIFYPDGESSFENQTQITSETAILSWYPENDSAATGGNYTFLVYWVNGTEVGFNRQYFWFTPIPSNLTLETGLPTPYVNDTTRSLLIRYNDTRGVNITGATLSASLDGITLEWEDLFSKSLDPQDEGLYRIKLNTTGLNSGQNYPLNLWAFRDGYENVTLQTQQVSVLPVPTNLVTNVGNITEYADEGITFSCSFKDIFHGVDIDWALVNYSIVGTPISGQMASIMPGESVYVAENVKLTNLTGRITPYQINITANASNCASQSEVINLYVLNKTTTILSLEIGSGLHIQGQKLRVLATLRNDSSMLGIANATIRFTFGDVILDQIAITDATGLAEIEIVIPDQAFTIEVYFDATTSIAQSFDSLESIAVTTYADIGLWVGLIAGACVASVIAIRQLYFVPKRKRKLKEYQKIAQKFQDVANLRHLLILHKDSSSCVFQQSFGESLDGDLISGFLTAIGGFQDELKPEKVPIKERKTGGFELLYQDYKIFVFTGSLASIAFIVEETPSDEFRQRAMELVQEYENLYHKGLIAFRGNLAPFKDSHIIIAEKLELSLVWPHQLNRPMSIGSFPSIQGAIINIAETTMRSQGTKYFFLPLIISIGQAGQPKAKLEVIAAVYHLHKIKIFEALNPISSE